MDFQNVYLLTINRKQPWSLHIARMYELGHDMTGWYVNLGRIHIILWTKGVAQFIKENELPSIRGTVNVND